MARLLPPLRPTIAMKISMSCSGSASRWVRVWKTRSSSVVSGSPRMARSMTFQVAQELPERSGPNRCSSSKAARMLTRGFTRSRRRFRLR